jgi:hypothetical protein
MHVNHAQAIDDGILRKVRNSPEARVTMELLIIGLANCAGQRSGP